MQADKVLMEQLWTNSNLKPARMEMRGAVWNGWWKAKLKGT